MKKAYKILAVILLSVSCFVGALSFAKADTGDIIVSGFEMLLNAFGDVSDMKYYNGSGARYYWNANYCGYATNHAGTPRSAFVIHVEFINTGGTTQSYTGDITVSLTGITAGWSDFAIVVNGGRVVQTSNASSIQAKVHIYGVSSVDIAFYSNYLFSNSNNFGVSVGVSSLNAVSSDETSKLNVISAQLDTINNGIDTIVDDIQDIYTELQAVNDNLGDILIRLNSLADYQINAESILAYYYVISSGSVSGIEYEDGDVYPSVNVLNEQWVRPLNIPAGETQYFYFYTSSNTISITWQYDRFSYLVETIPPIMSGYRLMKITISNDDNTALTDRFKWGGNYNIIPIYLGSGRNMSQEMQSLTRYDSPNLSTDLLYQILQALNGAVVSDNDVNAFNNIVQSITAFYNNLLSYLPSPSSFSADFQTVTDFTNDNITGVSSLVNYFYIELTDVFPAIQKWIVLGMVVIVLKVFIL